MPSTLFLLSIICSVSVPFAGQVPSAPPKADYPLFDAFMYEDQAAAQAVWKPMAGSKPVSLVNIAGKNVLRMPCNFKGTKIERASWDQSVSLDLAAVQGIQFSFYCPDPSPVSRFSFYFQSGNGWYAAGFSAGKNAGWNRVTVNRDDTRVEGSPAGWANIETIRISAWRGKDADTEMYVVDMGLLGADAPIVIVRGESAVKRVPSEAKAVRDYSRQVAGYLKDLGLSSVTIGDVDATAERLKGKKLVILPHNPGMPDEVAAELVKFIEGGGKTICFYGLSPKLRPIVGIEGGRHIRQTRPGYFASIRPAGKLLKGAPPITHQKSWNIGEAKPVEGKSRAAAYWYDDQGKSTGQAAIVVSDNCIVMTHVLLSDDPANKKRLLLAMVGHFVPELWRQTTQAGIARIGQLGPYAGFAETQRAIRKLAPQGAEVRRLVDRVAKLRGQAEKQCAAGAFPEAMSAAAEAHDLMLEAYCIAQPSSAGEFRAFWCHNAFGVSGMDWNQAIKILADNGFTAILPNMLWGGTAYYESDVLPVAPSIKEKGDQIAACLAACKKYGLECHVWKVNYNMSSRASKTFVETMKSQSRTQVRFDGKPNDRWLCPSHPANQKLEIDSMVEVATKYDVDGVHFDYIRYPNRDGCFCLGCRERFEKALGRTVESWPDDLRKNGKIEAKWLDFRRDQITAVVAAVRRELRKARPKCKTSAAVFRNWPTDRDRIGQDWKLWCEKGYLDFVCPMDYIADNRTFERTVRLQLPWAGDVPCYPGIGLAVWKPADDICKLIDQIRITRRLNTGGFIIFNYAQPQARNILPMCGKGITRKRSNSKDSPRPSQSAHPR